MILNKITIMNFKSIQNLEFDIKKYGNSYTTMFLGINEAGKSNILQAMSFLNAPNQDFHYSAMHNEKDLNVDHVNLYFDLNFTKDEPYLEEIKLRIKNSDALEFEISNIQKNVYLEKNKTRFQVAYKFDICNLTKELFIQINPNNHEYIINERQVNESYVLLTEKIIKEDLTNLITSVIQKYEVQATIWKPSDKYFISPVNLHEFKKNIESNIPLKTIFFLSGYQDQKAIQEIINQISIISLRLQLAKNLSNKTSAYIKSIWNHNIYMCIEITDSGMCNVTIQDDGKENECEFYPFNARSEGFKQFISLILSLSIENKKINKNQLILIDEPEIHLHPSGIRDLGKELLAIGENNYLFVATHSPFLIDRECKERNIIIKKDNFALTTKQEIKSEEDINDDEVLREAFGINVFKDLLNPHKILVEGNTDKVILQKLFAITNCKYGITNGIGSNIVTLASRFNDDKISILTITDDDLNGQKYRDNILKIGGVFNQNNVFTLRDLVPEINDGATIEDLLGKNYIESKFVSFYSSEFSKEISFSLNENSPYMEQIKLFLKSQNNDTKDHIDKFKIKISNDFNPTKSSLDKNFPFLKSLIEKIKEKL